MINPKIMREIAERYHRALPDEIREHLKGRGIPATVIERRLLGWNEQRITIPIFGRDGEVIAFRYAKPPGDASERPEVISDLSREIELYGWETLAAKPRRVVICASEFDRLVLEARGIPAVASTGGAGAFLEEWLPYFEPIKHVYACLDRSLAGATAGKRLRQLLRRVRIATLPPEVGQDGTIADFFAYGMTKTDFEVLLARAEDEASDSGDRPPTIREWRHHDKSVRRYAEGVKRDVRLHAVAAQIVELEADGKRLRGHCPFHADRSRSFEIYPEADVYRCGVCGVEGDVIRFLMDKESMTYGQALRALDAFRYTHELYGTS